MKPFSKKEAIGFGWQTMKGNFWFFLPLSVLYGLIEIAAIFFGFLELGLLLDILIPLIIFILSTIVRLGFIKISLNFCDNLKSKISDLFPKYRVFFRALFAGILYWLICLVGLIFLIIPGIYLGVRFWFWEYFIVDKRAGIIESLEKSWQITKGNVWNLFLFGLLLIIINLLALLCFIVGLFVFHLYKLELVFHQLLLLLFIVSLSVIFLIYLAATAFAYRKLLDKSKTLSFPLADVRI